MTRFHGEKARYQPHDRIDWPEWRKQTDSTRRHNDGETMTDRPVDLDEHRGMAAQKATEIRRRLPEVQVDQAALKARQAEFEKFLLAAPSANWAELAEKVRYLLQLFAADAQDVRRQKLIASVLDDLGRLAE
jgi:hypothetical protein